MKSSEHGIDPAVGKECAFCPHKAKLSAEHLWSAWMNDLFPGKKRFTRKNDKGEVTGQWVGPALDWKAKVVCQTCNNGWMSRLENEHAIPAITDLILGNALEMTKQKARSLALFALKTAVVFDHVQRDRTPFFSRHSRHRFAKCLAMPFGVQMWMAGFLPMGSGHVQSAYHQGFLGAANHLEMYVCTYAIGHLVFQVVAQRQRGFTAFSPNSRFEHVAIPFWPVLAAGACWPPADVLRTVDDSDAFHDRWSVIGVHG